MMAGILHGIPAIFFGGDDALKRKTTPEPTDGEIFAMVGRVLFEGDDWPSRFGAALDLSKQTVKNLRRDHSDLYPDVAANMLSLLERQAAENARAREAVKAWLAKHGQPEAGKAALSRPPTKRSAPRRD